HKLTHLRDNVDIKKPFKCDICGDGFARRQGLERHELSHLADDDPRKKVECDICGKILSRADILAVHKKTHLNDDDPEHAKVKRPFQCEIWGIHLRSANNLKG
ncbi:hypothetical protein PENTCL1PPCAC_26071, partial [Pristionchus entomophagus]